MLARGVVRTNSVSVETVLWKTRRSGTASRRVVAGDAFDRSHSSPKELDFLLVRYHHHCHGLRKIRQSAVYIIIWYMYVLCTKNTCFFVNKCVCLCVCLCVCVRVWVSV